MHILLFNLATDVDDPILGFTTRWIWALAKRVERIHVITMRAGRVEVPGNVRVLSVGKDKGYSEPRRAVEFYRHLFRVLHEGVDVCFSHMIPIFTVLGAPVLKFRGVPIVTWYAHPSLTCVLKLAHHLSNRIVSSLATAYPYKYDKLTVVGQGIDTDLFSSDGKMSLENPPIILCVGRLSHVKDHLTLLKAARLLRQRWDKPFQVVVVGGPASPRDEPYIRSLYKQVKDLGLEETVCFEPAVSMADLPSRYRRCTVHVNLTPTGFGDKVAWEAMSCSRPCLVANEGFNDTLGKYANHLLFRHGDPEDLAKKILALLNLSPARQEGMGGYLRERVIQRCGLERLAERLVEVFQEAQMYQGR